jgi:hypothetical protein
MLSEWTIQMLKLVRLPTKCLKISALFSLVTRTDLAYVHRDGNGYKSTGFRLLRPIPTKEKSSHGLLI